MDGFFKQSVEDRLKQLGHVLPEAPVANGLYRTWVIRNGELMTSGQLSRIGTSVLKGPIKPEDPLGKAHRAAEVCVLRCLSVAQQALGTLDNVAGVLSLRGYVACSSEFTEHSRVLDAASRLVLDVFGGKGEHIRTAIGVSSLPSGGLVELEMTFAVS